MIKLIVTDMDGTFLDDNKNYNKTLFAEVKKLIREKGIHFSISTGKQTARVEEILEEDTKDFFIMGDSAARIKHQDKFIYQSLLKNVLGLKIIERLESLDTPHIVIASTENGTFIKNTTSPRLQKRLSRSFSGIKLIPLYSDIKEDFIKISVFDEQGNSINTQSLLSDFSDKAYIVASEEKWIDIANHNVHKGTTVDILQKMLGVTYQETMVFGDGLNDIELMEKGAFSFAMGNGYEETKAMANHVIGTNNEDSVLKTIMQFLTQN